MDVHGNTCIICDKSLSTGGSTVLVKRGLSTIIKSSKEREDDLWKYLEGDGVSSSIQVHEDCRKTYTRKSSIEADRKASSSIHPDLSSPVKKKLRNEIEFDYRSHCLICSDECSEEKERKLNRDRRRSIVNVRTFDIQEALRKICGHRTDTLARNVQRRLDGVLCLIAAEAKYHKPCMDRFRNSIPSEKSAGRPPNADSTAAFVKVCQYIEEDDDCQFSVADLLEIMGDHAYTEKHLKFKLEEKYGTGNVIFTSVRKVGTIATIRCFGDSFKELVNDWYLKREDDEDAERNRIVRAAAKIIREDIRAKVYDTSYYPCPGALQSSSKDEVPETLLTFLREVISTGKKNAENYEKKCFTIAHTIISSTRPRTFHSSLLTGISVYLHRKFGSRLLLDLLSNVGLSTSYSEAQMYESSSLALKHECDSSFIQYVFDNADFNVNTLDGHNTFHQMGGIECRTPNKKVSSEGFPRVNRIPDAEKYVKENKIVIQHWDPSDTTLPGCKVANLNELKPHYCDGGKTMPSKNTLLWMLLSTKHENLPSWGGFMTQLTEQRTCYETSRVQCLPFINLPPSSYDAIFSVIKFVADKLKSDVKQSCIFLTFDQPLYAKAHDMLQRLGREDDGIYSKLILRLGGFHLLMSYMGALGHIMSGSGLQEVWSTIYAPNVASQMLTGHPYSRSLRAHFLTQLAIVRIIFQGNEELQAQVTELLQSFDTCSTTTGIVDENDNEAPEVHSTHASEVLLQELNNLCARGKTAALWVQYFHAVNLMRNFIEAERSGNWDLHIQTVQNMLPYFHASGHFHYARSAHMYVQDMHSLQNVMSPVDYHDFTTEGFFTIRRSDKFWSGLWTDLTIEQTLMRMIKSRGGLIGRGFHEHTMDKFLMSIPTTYDICEEVEKFSGVYSRSSEQHVELRNSRIVRDRNDVNRIISWFTEHCPFPAVEEIMCIANGVMGSEEVNCFKAYELGSIVLRGITGEDFSTLKLKRSDRVTSLTSKSSSITIRGETIPVNTNLLFQRIMCFAKDDIDLRECFSHELAPFPMSLFDQFGMRKTQKSSLYSLFTPCSVDVETDKITHKCHVIDGGFLLHRVHWPDGSTYDDVLEAYLSYVKRHFDDPIVVFDGYVHTDDNTKAAEQKRRYGNVGSNEILFTDAMGVTVSREVFLANKKNKSRLIEKLTDRFMNNGIAVQQSAGDADLLIVLTALDAAQKKASAQVYIVGEDVDLLVLLIYHSAQVDNVEVKLFKPGKTTRKQPSSVYSPANIRSQIPGIENYILFLHAFSGCDSTSAFFGKGKSTVFKWLQKSAKFRELAVKLQHEELQPEEVVAIGLQLVKGLYKCDDENTRLNYYRYTLFQKKVSKSSKPIQLETLPPTEDAASFHLLRVYHQTEKWQNRVLPPLQWGWSDSPLEAVRNSLAPAPTSVLSLISCSCKKECVKGCGCRKLGLKCSVICANCEGRSCFNRAFLEDVEDEEIEIEIDDDF